MLRNIKSISTMSSLRAFRATNNALRTGLFTPKYEGCFNLLRSSPARYYSASHSGTVKEITELPGFLEFVKSENVSVIDFYATWCGPCKALEPIFATLAEKIPEVQFGRVDVDEALDIATEYGITAMPTCLLFKNGESVDKIVGANPPKLLELIQQHAKVDLKGR